MTAADIRASAHIQMGCLVALVASRVFFDWFESWHHAGNEAYFAVGKALLWISLAVAWASSWALLREARRLP